MRSVASASPSRHPVPTGRLRRCFFGAAGVVVVCCLLWPLFVADVFGAGRYGEPLRFDDPPVDMGAAKGLYDDPPAQPVSRPSPVRPKASPQASPQSTPELTARMPESEGAFASEPDRDTARDSLLPDEAAGNEWVEAVDDAPPPSAVEVQGNEAYARAMAEQVSHTEQVEKADEAVAAKESEEKTDEAKPVRLFNTVDLFRKPIAGNAPQWERVVNFEKKKNLFSVAALRKGCPPAYINDGKR